METTETHNNTRTELTRKLEPSRFPRMSRLMAAIVGCILDARFVEPAIAEIVVTSDFFVLGRIEGEVGANQLVGAYLDLLRNWLGLLDAAGLTRAERNEAAALFAAKVGFWGRSDA